MVFDRSKEFPKFKQKKDKVTKDFDRRRKTADKKGVNWSMTKEEMMEILNTPCRRCGKLVDIIRRNFGVGTFEKRNIRLVCKACGDDSIKALSNLTKMTQRALIGARLVFDL